MSCHLLDFVKNSTAIYPSPLLTSRNENVLNMNLFIIFKRQEINTGLCDAMMLEQSRNMTPVTGSTCAKCSFALDRRRESDTT